MTKEVILTPLALRDFDNVIEYLTEYWGFEVVNNFIERFEKVTTLLSNNTSLYPFFDNQRGLQKCVLTKHNILFFTDTEQAVYIHAVFDTRQDPQKLNNL